MPGDISKDLTISHPPTSATLSHSKCVNRQRPSGKTNWQSEMAARFGLGSTLRPRGRPRIDKKSSPSPLCMISRCEIRGVRGLGNSSGQTREQLLHVTNSRPGLGHLLHDRVGIFAWDQTRFVAENFQEVRGKLRILIQLPKNLSQPFDAIGGRAGREGEHAAGGAHHRTEQFKAFPRLDLRAVCRAAVGGLR
jgi:hypothetical protein